MERKTNKSTVDLNVYLINKIFLQKYHKYKAGENV